MENEFRFSLSLFRADERPLGRFDVDIDFEPAFAWSRFEALRREDAAAVGGTWVEPEWHPERGEPFVAGFAVTGEGVPPTRFPITFFRTAAESVAARLVEQGKLERGESYLYVPMARRAPKPPRPGFDLEDAAPKLVLPEASLADGLARSRVEGSDPQGSMPALFPSPMLDEAKRLAAQAGENETGGVLVGHLCRDPETRMLFASVTAQIHARNARADRTSLHFTSETWTEVRAALALRNRSELMLGWWHSHPVSYWCRSCPEERQRACRLATDFFSEHDRSLHRTVFPESHSLGLVVNGVGYGEFTLSLFGWSLGVLEPRGFHVLEAT